MHERALRGLVSDPVHLAGRGVRALLRQAWFVAIPLVLSGSGLAKPAVWIFNIFGTLDLLTAITFSTIYNAPVTMGPAYWIPAFWVPLLLVTHYVTFVLLNKRWEP